MDNEKTKILVLVEGAKTDSALMEHLFSIYGINQSHQIISYNTNIYALYNQLFRDAAPGDMDLLRLLREHEPDATRKAIFDERYSDILLIFDLDPHDSQFSPEIIIQLQSYFVESSDMGKLYLNYPMVEAFYHMKSIPDKDYLSYTATMRELKNHSYKSRVTAENRNHDYRKFAATRAECNTVIKQNIEKARSLAHAVDTLADLLPDPGKVLGEQLNKISSESAVSVLCTCVFYIPDYNPLLLSDIETRTPDKL